MRNSSKRIAAVCVSAACVLGLLVSSCGEESGCRRQCEILSDCGAVDDDDISTCAQTCEGLLGGECDEDDGCVRVGSGGDPEECAEALLEANEEADGNECTDDFVTDWCDTYYDDPACAPFVLGGIECGGGSARRRP